MGIINRLEGLIYKMCDEYLEEENFKEYGFFINIRNINIGFGIIKYVNGKLGFEIIIEKRDNIYLVGL